MSPVNVAELPAEVRAKVMAQINAVTQSETVSLSEMTSEALVDHIVATLSAAMVTTLKDLEPYIREVWRRFDNGEVIKAGKDTYQTRKEFCTGVLGRGYRATHYMLNGGNQSRSLPASAPLQRCQISLTKQEHPAPVSNPQVADDAAQSEPATKKAVRPASEPETCWISKSNVCPTGKRGFDYPDDIWQLMKKEGSIGPRDFIAYIGKCGQCGKCHRDKDQSCHREGELPDRHQTWYRPDELNETPPSEPPVEPEPFDINSAVNSVLVYLERIVRPLSEQDAQAFYSQLHRKIEELIAIEASVGNIG